MIVRGCGAENEAAQPRSGRAIHAKELACHIRHRTGHSGRLEDVGSRAPVRPLLASLAALKQLGPEIRWIHSFVTDDKIYCIYDCARRRPRPGSTGDWSGFQRPCLGGSTDSRPRELRIVKEVRRLAARTQPRRRVTSGGRQSRSQGPSRDSEYSHAGASVRSRFVCS